METFKINSTENNKRMSTQELVQLIYAKVKEGISDFEIEACGQHNIGSSLWSAEGKTLNFKVKNPGQRVGGMALPGTKITVEGSAPADVGWLNSGAEITVRGDGGDTSAHCAAGGKIFIGGRTGTRSGAMMKHDPKYNPPQFWVLKNTGSFSFEFMGGGIAVICGHECEEMDSILGHRSCVGMVGGTIYFRGNCKDIANCVEIVPLEESDITFLQNGLNEFLSKIERNELMEKLSNFDSWKKIIPKEKKNKVSITNIKDFRVNEWVKGGIFGDFVEDDLKVYELATSGEGRLNHPVWTADNCVSCNLCVNNCPQSAITKDETQYLSDDSKCIGCGICEAVCPKQSWAMKQSNREIN